MTSLKVLGALQLIGGVAALFNAPWSGLLVGAALVAGALVLRLGRVRPPAQVTSDRIALARDGEARFALDLAPPHDQPMSAQARQPRTVMVRESGDALEG